MKKYKIVLQRLVEHKGVTKPKVTKIEDSTIGSFTIYNNETNETIWNCYTCENIGPSTDTPNQDKRIMPRTYQLEWTDSSKNGAFAKTYPEYKAKNGRNVAILLTCDSELPKFRHRRILIHTGNYPQDTEGCLLLGMANANGVVTQSTVAIKKFFDLMKELGLENVELEVKEIVQK